MRIHFDQKRRCSCCCSFSELFDCLSFPPSSTHLFTAFICAWLSHRLSMPGVITVVRVLLCFIDQRVRKIRNEASSCSRIFSRTLRFCYVASSPGSPFPHLLDGHTKLVGCSAIPERSCPGSVWYHWGSIVEFEVPPDETLGLMTLHHHNTNVLQSISHAKSPYPPDRSNSRQNNYCFRHEYG